MNWTRRTFIKTTGLAGAGAAVVAPHDAVALSQASRWSGHLLALLVDRGSRKVWSGRGRTFDCQPRVLVRINVTIVCLVKVFRLDLSGCDA